MKRSSSPRLGYAITRGENVADVMAVVRRGKDQRRRVWNRCRRAMHRMTERIAFRGQWGDLGKAEVSAREDVALAILTGSGDKAFASGAA